MRGFHSRLIQADEIWTFVRKKEDRLTHEERANPEWGDQYVFVALDAETKLIPAFAVGKRDDWTALRFMADLKAKLVGNGRIQLTTDGLRAYLQAVEDTFGADVDYAQLVKLYEAEHPGPGRYAPPRVSEVVSTVINGATLIPRASPRATWSGKKLDDPHAGAPVHQDYQRLQQEIGLPEGSLGPPLRVVQLRQDSPEPPGDAGDGGWDN